MSATARFGVCQTCRGWGQTADLIEGYKGVRTVKMIDCPDCGPNSHPDCAPGVVELAREPLPEGWEIRGGSGSGDCHLYDDQYFCTTVSIRADSMSFRDCWSTIPLAVLRELLRRAGEVQP